MLRRWPFLLLIASCGEDPVDDEAVANCEELHPDCAILCDDLCALLAECSSEGETTCASECEAAYLCAGETPDQDGTICRSRAQMTQDLSCAELCSESAFGQT